MDQTFIEISFAALGADFHTFQTFQHRVGLFDVLHLKHPRATCLLDLIRDALIRQSSNKSGSAATWES